VGCTIRRSLSMEDELRLYDRRILSSCATPWLGFYDSNVIHTLYNRYDSLEFMGKLWSHASTTLNAGA
jgi:hypothetical protein